MSNESLQLTSARSCGAFVVEWLDGTQTCILVSRLDTRPLAAELRR